MRSFSKQVRAVATIALIAAACRPIPTPSRPDKTSSEPSKAQVPGPAASMSHGEAPLGTPMTKPDRAADAPTPLAGHRLRLRMTTVHIRHQVAPGVVYDAWSFDSMVPGPIVRASVGDTVDFTLVNGGNDPALDGLSRGGDRSRPRLPQRHAQGQHPLPVRGAGAGCLHVSLRHRAGGRAHLQRDVRRADRRPARRPHARPGSSSSSRASSTWALRPAPTRSTRWTGTRS